MTTTPATRTATRIARRSTPELQQLWRDLGGHTPDDFRAERVQRAIVAELAERRECANPVIKTTALKAYPGWVVREYANGVFDATDGKGLGPGETSFADAVRFARNGGEVI